MLKSRGISLTMKANILNRTVVVSALGYFVDIYDLLLFGIVRVSSLKSLGVPDSELLSDGFLLINAQMFGMLIGGIIWGILGDKKGRLSVLFGSILVYSLANIANAFATSVEVYALLRFLAGVGLAGELGAAITLVSETMSKENRGYGTTVVAAVGILGAVVAGLVGDFFTWQTAYVIGGVMGLGLLLLRVSMFESGLFQHLKDASVAKGDIFMLLKSRSRFLRYIRCILIGVPLWFVVGILMTFSPELSKALGVIGPVAAGKSIMYGYLGLAIGDFASGFLSQWMKSRKKVVMIFLSITSVLVLVYVFSPPISNSLFYVLCSALGFAVGYWAVFATVSAEQFGTNLRATVAITTPNFVRGAVVLLTSAFQALIPRVGILNSALVVGVVTLTLAYISLYYMTETFGKDLDYLET